MRKRRRVQPSSGVSLRVVAILETMWDWRGQTSGAGYKEAPRYFRINPKNFSGRRLYRLVGPTARMLVTNACRDLGNGPRDHGTPDPAWLGENLRLLDGQIPGSIDWKPDVLLVCGKIAQRTYKLCGYTPAGARVIEIPHPAARVWTRVRLDQTAQMIQRGEQ